MATTTYNNVKAIKSCATAAPHPAVRDSGVRTFASYLVTALSALPLLTPATTTATTTHRIAGASAGFRLGCVWRGE